MQKADSYMLVIKRCSGLFFVMLIVYEPVREKTNNLGSDQVRHKQACTDSYRRA